MSQDAAVKPSTSPSATLIHGRRERTAIAAAPAPTLAERPRRCARICRLTAAPPPPQRPQPQPLPTAEAPTPARARSAPRAQPAAGCSRWPRAPLRSGSGFQARVGSETSPGGGSKRSCRRRRRSGGGGGNASAPRLPPCHRRAWSLPPRSFPSPRPRSPPPAPPAAGLRTGPEEEPQAPRLPAGASARRGISPSPALGRPPSVPGSGAGLPSGRKRSLSGRLRLPAPTPPRPSSRGPRSPSHFPSRPAPPPASRRPRPGAPLPSSRRVGSTDLIGGARVPNPRRAPAARGNPQPVTSRRDPSPPAPPRPACAPLRAVGPVRVSLAATPQRLLSPLGVPLTAQETIRPVLAPLLEPYSPVPTCILHHLSPPLSLSVSPEKISEGLEIPTLKGWGRLSREQKINEESNHEDI